MDLLVVVINVVATLDVWLLGLLPQLFTQYLSTLRGLEEIVSYCSWVEGLFLINDRFIGGLVIFVPIVRIFNEFFVLIRILQFILSLIVLIVVIVFVFLIFLVFLVFLLLLPVKIHQILDPRISIAPLTRRISMFLKVVTALTGVQLLFLHVGTE